MNHRQARDLLAGYALGALEVREQDDLLEHLQSCSACYPLAQEAVEVAAMLAGGIAEAEPPAALKTRVQDSLAEFSVSARGRMVRAGPPLASRLGLTGRWPAFAVSATASIAVVLLGIILVYVVISQGDIGNLRDDNAALTAQLKEQGTAVATSQAELAGLGQASQSLSAKLDSQASAIAVAQKSLEEVREVNRSSLPTLGKQSDALAAAQRTLSDLQRDNRDLAAQLDKQRAVLATSQQSLEQIHQDNGTLTARIGDQDAVLASSQSDIQNLRAQALASAATVNQQQIFTYLLALPVTRKFVLNSTAAAPGTFGLLVTNPNYKWGVAVLLGVDPLRPGKAYQLWLEKDGVATSGGMVSEINPNTKFGQVYIPEFPTPVSQFSKMYVTLEPALGSVSPTGPALLAANIIITP